MKKIHFKGKYFLVPKEYKWKALDSEGGRWVFTKKPIATKYGWKTTGKSLKIATLFETTLEEI